MKFFKTGIKSSIYIFSAVILAITMFPAGKVFSAVISSEKIETELLNYAKNRFEKEGTEVEISLGSVRDIEILGEDNPEIRIKPASDVNIRRTVPVVVEITDPDGKIIRRIRYTLRVRVYMEVASAAKNIKRGEKITGEDVLIKKADVTGLEMFYRSAKEIDGLEAKTDVRSGTVLSSLNICPQFMIKRGDKVSVEVKSGNVFISAEGIARENGFKGGEIKVFIGMTKTVIKCRVVDSETVTAES